MECSCLDVRPRKLMNDKEEFVYANKELVIYWESKSRCSCNACLLVCSLKIITFINDKINFSDPLLKKTFKLAKRCSAKGNSKLECFFKEFSFGEQKVLNNSNFKGTQEKNHRKAK